MFVDGTWQKLANYTVNPSTCTVEVPSASAGLIAVLSSASKPISSSDIIMLSMAVTIIVLASLLGYIIRSRKLHTKNT